MIRLNLSKERQTLNLGHGVEVTVDPLNSLAKYCHSVAPWIGTK